MISKPDTTPNRIMSNVANYFEMNPRVPASPVLSLDTFGRDKARCGSVLDVGQVKLTLNARTALAHALRHAKIGQGTSVMLPAYHCPAMVSPMAWLGVEPIFFPIRPDTTVDVGVLAHYVRPNTRALLAVHYFGFIQDMSSLRKFCDERNLLLIEDCAHAFFGSADEKSLGRNGDYAIASLMKFLPIDAGGCLVSARRSLDDIRTNSGNLFFQIKSALNILELACNYGRLPWLKYLLKGKSWLWKRVKKDNIGSEPKSIDEDIPHGCPAEYRFEPASLNTQMSWPSSVIMKAMSFSFACGVRRANYLSWLESFTGVSGCRPLYASLPDGVFPQVFPLLIDDPDRVFPALKSLGVPIIRFGEYRWKGVDGSVCPVSDELSRRVFQFPCHQSLKPSELEWMICAVRSVL